MSAFKQIIIGLVAGAAFVCSHAQTKLPPAWQSSLVRISGEGILTYIPDKDGNTIPDFSRVGYHHGDKSIPRYPVVKVVSPVKEGDSGALIQTGRLQDCRFCRDKHRWYSVDGRRR